MATEALTLGKYHYWDDYEDDCTKRFHYFTGSDGQDHHIDFSPYHRPTEPELEAVREFTELMGYVPTAVGTTTVISKMEDTPKRGSLT